MKRPLQRLQLRGILVILAPGKIMPGPRLFLRRLRSRCVVSSACIGLLGDEAWESHMPLWQEPHVDAETSNFRTSSPGLACCSASGDLSHT